MKKRRFLPYIVSLFLLTGCGSSGSIYSNFRDVADLLPVQTLGYDRVDGKVRLSVSSGRGTDELPTVILQGSGSSITEALEMVQDYSDWEDLFFAHIRYVVVGEQAAREGLDELMDWFERIPQTRLDVPIFLVEPPSSPEAGISTRSPPCSTPSSGTPPGGASRSATRWRMWPSAWLRTTAPFAAACAA